MLAQLDFVVCFHRFRWHFGRILLLQIGQSLLHHRLHGSPPVRDRLQSRHRSSPRPRLTLLLLSLFPALRVFKQDLLHPLLKGHLGGLFLPCKHLLVRHGVRRVIVDVLVIVPSFAQRFGFHIDEVTLEVEVYLLDGLQINAGFGRFALDHVA